MSDHANGETGRERCYAFDPRGIDPAIYRHHGGLDVLNMVMRGELPMAPIGPSLNFTVTEAAPGRVVIGGTPERAFYNFTGAVQGGWAAAILDAAVGLAVLSALPRGKVGTTLELSVRYVRPITETVGAMLAEGHAVHVGRRMGTAEGRLVGLADGKLYAHASTSCLVMDA